MNSERNQNLTEAVESLVKHFGYPDIKNHVVDAMGAEFVLALTPMHNVDHMLCSLVLRGFHLAEGNGSETYTKTVDMTGTVSVSRRLNKPLELHIGIVV